MAQDAPSSADISRVVATTLKRSQDDRRTSAPPYLGYCGFDAAKAILDHLYPKIDTGKVRSFGSGTLQQVTFSSLPQNAYMENWAYLYTPAVCGNNQACGLVGDYDTRTGVQLRWIATAAQQLGGPAAAPGR
ncbi:hypothetical protein [Bordetella genomosp. 9]|nr:hypothetical protein [Bordetella genomosp. 9]